MRSLLVVSLTVVLCGCDHQKRAAEGVDALANCDYRTANTSFEAAFDQAPDNADYALAYTLTTLPLLVEDPALQSLAPRLGFTASLDSSVLWSKEGVLSQLSQRSTSCSAVWNFARSKIPHPSVRDNGPLFASTIDPTLTMGEVRSAMLAMRPRFEKLARAAEVAGKAIDEKGPSERFITLKGGCGAGTVVVQAPELLTIAFAFRSVVAAVDASLGYDGAMNVKRLFSSYDDLISAQQWVDTVGNRLLRVTDATAVANSRASFVKMVDTGKLVTAALRRTSTPASASLDWSRLPFGWVDDADAWLTFGANGLERDEPVSFGTFTPELRMNVKSFFLRPYAAPSPLYVARRSTSEDGGPLRDFYDGGLYRLSDGGTEWGEADCVGCQDLTPDLGARFFPNLNSPGYSGSSTFRWGTWDDNWRPLLDPSVRWSSTLQCQ
jgi:hypothetical protein